MYQLEYQFEYQPESGHDGLSQIMLQLQLQSSEYQLYHEDENDQSDGKYQSDGT